jgi:hypothetical protein
VRRQNQAASLMRSVGVWVLKLTCVEIKDQDHSDSHYCYKVVHIT